MRDAKGLVQEALLHHQAGRLAEAEALYRQALAREPREVDALHFLGVIAYQRGDAAGAETLISEALALHPANAVALNNLGNALAAQNKSNAALRAYLEALSLDPGYADALTNLGALRASGRPERAAALPAGAPLGLGLSHMGAGRVEEAIACFREALALQPESADAHFNLGNAYRTKGLHAEAVAHYEEAVALAPDFPEAHVNLGSVRLEQGEIQGALASSRKAVVLAPELPEAQYNLGAASFRAGDFATVRSALTRYLRGRPEDRDALLTLGDACSRSNALDEAAAICERILARDPADASAHNLLGNVRRNQARHAEAMAHYEQAIRHDPNPQVAFQNLLFCLLCTGSATAADVHARHVEFARRFEPAARPAAAHTVRDPERRLRIGYVSPDFRSSVVGHYMQPILERHDRAAFEAHCYAVGPLRDAVTRRIASLADRFHDVYGLSDDAIADRIRADGIDLLVDLCGHGPGNRILVFARRPAPVAVSYLDYSATTGLSSMDYRLTTEDCDPSGVADRYYSERLVRLAGGYWTYNPSVRRAVTALPARANGHVTFGSFNLYYRITDEVLDLWGRVLASVPRSRLLIVSVAAGSAQTRLLERLGRAGVSPHRVAVHDVVPYERYHELMGAVDIALAPFPYNGATTVMDCLWNGLPVVALRGGETFWTRLGCSVLTRTGLDGMIADDAQAYVRIAAELAGSIPALAALRAGLRETLERSPFRDFTGFTRELERAYREMWRAWCAGRDGRGTPGSASDVAPGR